MAKSATSIRVGVGGWTFEPWRNNFFPKGLSDFLDALSDDRLSAWMKFKALAGVWRRGTD